MSLLDQLFYRAMEIYAHAIKFSCDFYSLIFSNHRIYIPVYSPARHPPSAQGRIPRVIWQTNYTRRVTPQVYLCFLFNRLLSPTCEYNFCDDEACDRFVAENFPPEVVEAYGRLQIGAARADFWRVLVLLKRGGIYLDIDANFTVNPERFLGRETEGVFITMKEGEVTNYFLASAPNNPVLREACDRIVRNINEGVLTSVYDLTGPIVLEAAVKTANVACLDYKKACVQGQFVNKRSQYADKPKEVWSVAQELMPIVGKGRSEGVK